MEAGRAERLNSAVDRAFGSDVVTVFPMKTPAGDRNAAAVADDSRDQLTLTGRLASSHGDRYGDSRIHSDAGSRRTSALATTFDYTEADVAYRPRQPDVVETADGTRFEVASSWQTGVGRVVLSLSAKRKP